MTRLVRKIRLVAASDLALAGKLRYLRDLAVGSLRRNVRRGPRAYRLQDGISVFLRASSTDEKVFEEIFIQRMYTPFAKAAQRAAPVILVDLGANVGLSVISLARELRPLAIVAVEPDRGNFATLQENLRLAGLQDLCTSIRAFAGTERGFAELVDSGNGAWGMRMGEPARSGIPVLPVAEIIEMGWEMARNMAFDNGEAAHKATQEPMTVLKCDIEGAEVHLFRQLRQWEDRVHYVILELHTEFLSVEDFHTYLEASRYHWRMDGDIPANAVLGVIGLERLESKTAVPSQRAAAS